MCVRTEAAPEQDLVNHGERARPSAGACSGRVGCNGNGSGSSMGYDGCAVSSPGVRSLELPSAHVTWR